MSNHDDFETQQQSDELIPPHIEESERQFVTMPYAAFLAVCGEDFDPNRFSEINGRVVRSPKDEVIVYINEDAGFNNWSINEPDEEDPRCDEPEDHFRDDVEADADVLRSAGYGTDEDYGYAGDVL